MLETSVVGADTSYCPTTTSRKISRVASFKLIVLINTQVYGQYREIYFYVSADRSS